MKKQYKESCNCYQDDKDNCEILKGKCILDDEKECPNFEGNLEWFLEL